MNTKHYVRVTDNIHTSGQPLAEEFKDIADLNTATILNLAMPDSDCAMANEGSIVSSLGMNYFHIPVKWESPRIGQYQLFRDIMKHHSQQVIWVHCALNWRVSSFIYCYKVESLGLDKTTAFEELKSVWKPNQVWRDFIQKITG